VKHACQHNSAESSRGKLESGHLFQMLRVAFAFDLDF
jgi:hypothetical protein